MTRLTAFQTLFTLLFTLFVGGLSSQDAYAKSPKQKSVEHIVKVGSYNICTPKARVRDIKNGAFKTTQRYWANSAEAVADMINILDCDVIGFQEVGDSTWGMFGNVHTDIRALVNAERSKKEQFVWIAYPNLRKGKFGYNTGICYRKDKFKLLDDSIIWLGGLPDQMKSSPEAPVPCHRPAHYVKLKHKASKQVFWFFTAHFSLERRGKENGSNLFNAKMIVDFISKYVPAEDRVVIVGDLNSSFSMAGCQELIKSGYNNSYLVLKDRNQLSENVLLGGSQPTKDETGLVTWWPDHIFYRGFSDIVSFDINRSKLPTKDGTLHYPSDHFPITAELKL